MTVVTNTLTYNYYNLHVIKYYNRYLIMTAKSIIVLALAQGFEVFDKY
jgi:hypothetical protein